MKVRGRRYIKFCQKQFSQMFFKINVLKNFAYFTGKNLFWGLFLIKLQTFKPRAQVFPYKISEIFKTTFFYRTPPATASERGL